MRVTTVREATPQDEPFLKSLFFEIRSPEFALAQLPDAQLQILLGGQYGARRGSYASQFPNAVYEVLEVDGEAVGYDVWEDGAELHLIDIAVCSRFRNQGLGTERLLQLQSQARAEGKCMVLSVAAFNPARRLYERLGFEAVGEAGVYQRMRWADADSGSERTF